MRSWSASPRRRSAWSSATDLIPTPTSGRWWTPPSATTSSAWLQSGLSEGARVVAQGRLPPDERLRDGFWVAPTVLADVTPSMAIAQEEIFGPIACVMRFADEDEAIAICNGTRVRLDGRHLHDR